MKNIIALICILIPAICFSQRSAIDRNASYKHYGQYLQAELQLTHQLQYKGEFDSLKGNYTFLVTFNVDTPGNVINFSFDEKVPTPAVVKNYSKNLIMSTSGKWLPQIKNCRVVESELLTCQVHIIKKVIINKEFYDKLAETDSDFVITKANSFDASKPNCFALIISY